MFNRESAWGKKLSLWRLVLVNSALQRRPEDLYKSWMEGRSALMILSAVLIIRCSLDLSCFVDEPNHTEMDEDRTD
ncbi:hypothetical protein AMECASPLE_029505 [Ameca splendens]|uniref:Uncharacterized protein n=1 Tax=Ameca splendens TaxID=208324 RepID=A0ABV0ZGL9_9TELE